MHKNQVQTAGQREIVGIAGGATTRIDRRLAKQRSLAGVLPNGVGARRTPFVENGKYVAGESERPPLRQFDGSRGRTVLIPVLPG